jgi:hypothetical protein
LGLSPSVTQAEIDECYERYERQDSLNYFLCYNQGQS